MPKRHGEGFQHGDPFKGADDYKRGYETGYELHRKASSGSGGGGSKSGSSLWTLMSVTISAFASSCHWGMLAPSVRWEDSDGPQDCSVRPNRHRSRWYEGHMMSAVMYARGFVSPRTFVLRMITYWQEQVSKGRDLCWRDPGYNCSAFGKWAVSSYGAFLGGLLTVYRIMHCRRDYGPEGCCER